MGAPGRASLRRYVARFGFERLAKALSAEATEYVAVYGSLREGFALPDAPDVGSALLDRGNCRIPGQLYDLGEYPGLVPGEGSVVGDLFEVRDLSVFRLLDRYERYDALHPKDSLYLRRVVRLLQPQVDAWVYLYNRTVEGKAPHRIRRLGSVPAWQKNSDRDVPTPISLFSVYTALRRRAATPRWRLATAKF